MEEHLAVGIRTRVRVRAAPESAFFVTVTEQLHLVELNSHNHKACVLRSSAVPFPGTSHNSRLLF